MCKYDNQRLTVVLALCVFGLVLGGPLNPASARDKPTPDDPNKPSVDVTNQAALQGQKQQDGKDADLFKREYLNFKALIQKYPDDPQIRYDFAGILDGQGRRSEALQELERAVQMAPDNKYFASKYRMQVRKYGDEYLDRSIRFFEDLVVKHPHKTMPRLNKALAYVDKMPYADFGIVNEGIVLSNKSLQELDSILQDDPNCWVAKFMRGMNHLHWPRMFGHAPLATVDFTELIVMHKTLPAEKQRYWDQFAFMYVALGDSYVKNRATGLKENLAKARQVWEAGFTEYPTCSELKERLDLITKSEKELIAYVEKHCGLENPIDTNLRKQWVYEE